MRDASPNWRRNSGVTRAWSKTRDRLPQTARHVGSGQRRHFLRVDRWRKPAFLQEARGGQSHHSAADHGALAPAAAGRKIHGQLGGAPGERDAGAAMPVVVDHGLGIELLRAHHESRRAEGTQTHRAADHAAGETRTRARRGNRGRRRNGDPPLRAGCQTERGSGQKAAPGERCHTMKFSPNQPFTHRSTGLSRKKTTADAGKARPAAGT